jgi:acetoin utilization protein AcuB
MELDAPVSTFMTRAVTTVSVFQPLSEARRVMMEGGFHHVPVVEGRKLVGILSSLDLLRVSGGVAALPLQSGSHALTIATLMRRDLVTVREDTPLAGALALFAVHPIHCLPVVDDQGALVGLITTLDVVRAVPRV